MMNRWVRVVSGKRMMRRAGFGVLLAAAAALAPRPAEAQNRSLGIWAGSFSPWGSTPTANTPVTGIAQRNSFAGGARLTFWGSKVLGLEVVGGVSPAKAMVAGAPVNGSRSVNVFAGGLKLLVGLSPSLSPVGFHIGAGPAIVRRGRDVTSGSNSETNLGAVLGGGVRFPISSGLGIRLDLEDYVYKGTLGGIRKTRNYLVTSAGLNIAF